jgi:hypothetical protein
MDDELPSGGGEVEVSLEDELRNQFGANVLYDNFDNHGEDLDAGYGPDTESHYDPVDEHDDVVPPDDEMAYGPMDLRASRGAVHRISASDSDEPEEEDQNPLRALIRQNQVNVLLNLLTRSRKNCRVIDE